MSHKDTLLVVDDNQESLRLFFNILSQAGYEVLIAQDGPSTLKRLEYVKPDLILLDVMMPGMDGFETARRLKALPENRNIPIVFLTGLNDMNSIVKGFEVGGIDYLVKPLRPEELLVRVNTHLSLRKSQRRLKARTRELFTLLELSYSLITMIDLESLANLILDKLKTVVDYTCSILFTVTDEYLHGLAYRGTTAQKAILQEYFSGKPMSRKDALSALMRPLVIADLQADEPPVSPLSQGVRDLVSDLCSDNRAIMIVPLAVKTKTVGLLVLGHQQPNIYTSHHTEIASAFANQAAVAIENVRLYQQARQAAAHEERNRLARTLHDSVSQALFSASLIAEVMPQVWERDPQEGQQGLYELRRLTQGALAEMRSLLLELRPTALLKARLDELLRQLAQAAANQIEVDLKLELAKGIELPEEVHVTFYRVAQEALNNIVKHAQADTITVSLQTTPDQQQKLVIRDDGRGFNDVPIMPGKLGLGIMQERAAQIDANLSIVSRPGRGTQVALIWPKWDAILLP